MRANCNILLSCLVFCVSISNVLALENETFEAPPLLGFALPSAAAYPEDLQPIAEKLPGEASEVIKNLSTKKDPQAALLRGFAHLLLSAPEKALSSFKRAREYRAAQPYALYGEALALHLLNQHEKALVAARDAYWFRSRAASIPEAALLTLIGHVELSLGKPRAGALSIEKALRADPYYPSAVFIKVNLSEFQGTQSRGSLLRASLGSPSFASLNDPSKRTLEIQTAEEVLSEANRKFGKNDFEFALAIAEKYRNEGSVPPSERIRATAVAVRALIATEKIGEANKILASAKKEWPTSHAIERLSSQLQIERGAEATSTEESNSSKKSKTREKKEKSTARETSKRNPS